MLGSDRVLSRRQFTKKKLLLRSENCVVVGLFRCLIRLSGGHTLISSSINKWE